MIRKFLGKLLKSEEQEELVTPATSKGIFTLTYEDLVIGELEVEGGIWRFRYSKEFKEQDEVKKLVDFPDTEKVYESPDLWPFFAHRIPGLGQPQVQEILKKENIDKQNVVDLLKHFGRRSIANPFVLVTH